jgi:hypothetical protein
MHIRVLLDHPILQLGYSMVVDQLELPYVRGSASYGMDMIHPRRSTPKLFIMMLGQLYPHNARTSPSAIAVRRISSFR